MSDIAVFSKEIEDGVAEQVRANASIAYTTKVEEFKPDDALLEKVMASLAANKNFNFNKALASLNDSDLFFNKSLLVTTIWNNNDDVFDPTETWAARHTPAHKPDNINHDDSLIIGHMIDSWPIDMDGKSIADNTALDNIPNMFHLINSAVIYRSWSKTEIKEKVEELIAKILAGEGTVSMECLFRGFDYGVITPNGENKIVARNKETAFLTKHLRAYGGDGKFQEHKVGRILRRMTFSGKGYLIGEKPANPASVVFASKDTFNFTKASKINTLSNENGVSIFCGSNATSLTKQERDNNMSTENKILEDQITELKASVKALTEENKTLAEQSSKASVEKLEKTISDLTAKVESLTKAAEANTTEKTALSASVEDLTKKLNEVTEAKTSLETELNNIKAENIKATRISTLVDGGVAKEEATATVEKFAALSDEQFAAIAELAVKAAKMPKQDETVNDKNKKGAKAADETIEDDKEGETSASATDLNDAETDKELALSGSGAGSEVDTASETRKTVASWFEAKLSGSTKK